jgi:hypothetical protein
MNATSVETTTVTPGITAALYPPAAYRHSIFNKYHAFKVN